MGRALSPFLGGGLRPVGPLFAGAANTPRTNDTEPVNFQVPVTFAEWDGNTGLTMRMLFPSAAARDSVARKYGAVEGAHQTLGRLAEHLARM